MKFKQYLIESKISNNDIKKIMGFIENPKQGHKVINIKNFGDVDIHSSKNEITFTYDTNFYEITAELVDIVDLVDEYNFKTKINGDNTVFNIKIDT